MAIIDRIAKAQDACGDAICAYCSGERTVVIKNEIGEEKDVPCPICRGKGSDSLVLK